MRLLFLSALLFLAFGAAVMAAKDQEPTTKPSATQPATQPSAGKPVNKFCAVDHDNEVDPKVTVIYKGKVIGFCCKDCIKDFEKDPDKYVAAMK